MSDDSFRRVARIGLAPLVEEPPEAPDWHAVSTDAVLEEGSPRRNSWVPVVLATAAVVVLVVAAVLLRREPETPPVLGTDWSTVAFPEGFSGVNATTTWTGEELIVWGGQAENVDETPTGEPGLAYDPSTGAWRELPASPKRTTVGAASVWTGDKLIICCGAGDLFTDFNETVAYDPAADRWRRLADSPLSGTYTQAIWTGDVVLVVASGGVAAYDPDLDTWQTYSAPPEETRIGEIAWTGDELIVWSREVERAVHSGFALSLESDTWRRLPDPPAWPAAPDIVWTGDRLVIWGGLPARSGGSERGVGSVYDPRTDTWSAMSEVLPEPEPFEGNLGSQSLFWTGDRVLVSPGAFSSGVPNGETPILTYDPTNDTWEQVDTSLLPPIPWFGEAIQADDRTILIGDQLHISPPGWIPEGDPVTTETWAVTASSTTTTTRGTTTSTTIAVDVPPEGPLFGEETGILLLLDDGLEGLIAVDPDGRRAAKSQVVGQRPGDEPFSMLRVQNSLVVGFGSIYAVDIQSREGSSIGEATIFLPSARSASVWLVDWPGGRIGSGDPSAREVSLTGELLIPEAELPSGATPLFGIEGGLALQSPSGIDLWGATTGEIRNLSAEDYGRVLDVEGPRMIWCENRCERLWITDTDTLATLDVPLPGGREASGAAFSPDGSWLAAPVFGTTAASGLFLLHLETNNQILVGTTEPFAPWPFVIWADDNNQVFLTGNSYGDAVTRLSRYDILQDDFSTVVIPIGGGITPAVVDRSLASQYFLPEFDIVDF